MERPHRDANLQPLRFSLCRIAGALAIPPSLIVLISLCAQWSHQADLLTHFRWHAALSLSMLIAIPLILRRWRYAAILAAPTLLAWILIVPLLTWGGLGNHAPTHERMRVAVLNLLYTNNQHDSVAEWLETSQADLVVFLEVTPSWWIHLTAHERWPIHAGEPSSDAFGILVVARKPWQHAELLLDPKTGTPSVMVETDWLETNMQIFATHPVPPISASSHLLRNQQMEWIAQKAKQHQGPRVIIGDLNCTPYSPHFQQWCSTAKVVDTARGQLPIGTWPRPLGRFGIPIDHVLASPDLALLQRSVMSVPGSDHRAVVVDLALAHTN